MFSRQRTQSFEDSVTVVQRWTGPTGVDCSGSGGVWFDGKRKTRSLVAMATAKNPARSHVFAHPRTETSRTAIERRVGSESRSQERAKSTNIPFPGQALPRHVWTQPQGPQTSFPFCVSSYSSPPCAGAQRERRLILIRAAASVHKV